MKSTNPENHHGRRHDLGTLARRAAVALILLLGGMSSADAQAETIEVELSEFARMLDEQFSDAVLYLDNYGPRRVERSGATWHDPKGSYLRLAGEKQVIDLPQVTKQLRRKRLMYYVQDMKSNRIEVKADGNRLKLEIEFESNGHELKGHCVRKAVLKKRRWKRDCIIGGDGGAPDGDVNNAILTFGFALVPYNGSVSYKVESVALSANISIGGVCKLGRRILKGNKDICDVMFHYKKRLNEAMVRQVKNQLGKSKYRKRVADRVRELFFDRIGSDVRVTGVRVANGKLLIDMSSPAPRTTRRAPPVRRAVRR